MFGGVIGGALVVNLGYQVAVYADAGTFLLSALLISLVRTAPATAAAVRKWSVLATCARGCAS
ncbi:hypothetical protein [Nonomuraea sp. NPDC052265]|uniref:hypothetical protein n=1 Tax=Nonomuraea sp. NPDC052265 TaxID=3364374 RepID=UPI0037C502B8